jgi:hypothetical protein
MRQIQKVRSNAANSKVQSYVASRKPNLMWQLKSPILCGKSPILCGNSKVQFYVAIQSPILRGNQRSDLMRRFKVRSYAAIRPSSFVLVLTHVPIYQSNLSIYLFIFVWFLHLRQFVRLLRLRHLSFHICLALMPATFTFPFLSGSYTCGNLSGSYVCDIYLLSFVRFLYLRQFVRFLHLRQSVRLIRLRRLSF